MIPNHIGIILDGNRRWAKAQGKPTIFGHRAGFLNVKKILKHAKKIGVKILTVYAFSTENWDRAEAEVNYLMKIFDKMLTDAIRDFPKQGIQFRHLGDPSRFTKNLQDKLKQLTTTTKNNKDFVFCVALNYGGRDELVRACRKIVAQKINPNDIAEQTIADNIDTAGLPDPDFIIRTSGEQRLSGFLLWQSAYSELYFPKVCWPAFDEKELEKAVDEFNVRQRRFGK